jgi:hypothetical protein
MGYFSAYLGGSKPTKYLVAGRVAALIACVIQDAKVSGLVAGSILLRSDSTVAFRGGSRGGGGQGASAVVANVALKVHCKKYLSDLEIPYSHLSTASRAIMVDRLTYAVISEFEEQASGFAEFAEMFKPVGNYVFIGMSAQYRAASKNEDQSEMERLLSLEGETHYLMETYENMGGAKVREQQLAETFVGGVVDSFQLMI